MPTRMALSLLILTLVSACGPTEDFTAIAPDPESLLGGLKSYSTPEAVRLTLGNRQWTVTEESRLAPNDRRPPFNIFSVVIRPYEDKGDRGELYLMFFNSRLMSTVFYPRDPVAYRAQLGTFAPRDKLGDELRPKHLRVWHAVDYKKREYFLWGDDRLIEQRNRWIMRYS